MAKTSMAKISDVILFRCALYEITLSRMPIRSTIVQVELAADAAQLFRVVSV